MIQQAFDFRAPCYHPEMGVAVNRSSGLQTLFCYRCRQVLRSSIPQWYGVLLARRFNRVKRAKDSAV